MDLRISNIVDTANDLETLANVEAELRNGIRVAMTSGDVNSIVIGRDQISSIPIKRRALELAQLKRDLKQIEERRAQNDSDKLGLVAIRKEIEEKLKPLLERVEEVSTEIQKASFTISMCDVTEEGLLVERREKRARLEEITAEIEAELDRGEINEK